MFPVFNTRYALRKVDELIYLMDPYSGDYYEVDEAQLMAFRLSDGTNDICSIARKISMPENEVEDFFKEQNDDGFVSINKCKLDNPINIKYVESHAPHISDVLIEITGRCNLVCKHCFNSKLNCVEFEKQTMSLTQIKTLINELDLLNVRRIQISGGEPLTRNDIWEIIDAIDEHKIFLDVISTNATLITPEMAKRFGERFGEYGALYISLDGITKEAYEGLRGANTFPVIMRSFDLLEQYGCRIFVNTMAYKGNISELENMYEWLKSKKNIIGWRVGLPKVLGRYEEYHSHLEVEFEEVIKVFCNILKKWFTERPSLRLELSDFFRTDALEVGYETHALSDHPCKYALTNASIKPNGNVVYCASMEMYPPASFGNAVESGLNNVWYGKKHMDYRGLKIADLKTCSECRYLKLCGGGCRSNALLSYEDFLAPDPRACVAMKSLEDYIIPLMPSENQKQILELIDRDKEFALPTGYKKFI